jgi:hypothetical protein
MAEINLEKKRGPGAWVWVVALIVLAILVWALFFRHSAPRTAGVGVTATAPSLALSGTGGVAAA